jgi:hypothetical protein
MNALTETACFILKHPRLRVKKGFFFWPASCAAAVTFVFRAVCRAAPVRCSGGRQRWQGSDIPLLLWRFGPLGNERCNVLVRLT